MTTKEKEKAAELNKLKWRLSERLSVDNIEKLLNLKVIDEDEAKQLLFSEEKPKEPQSYEDLEKENKFLRELVEKLAEKQPKDFIKVLGGCHNHYYHYYWYTPYYGLASSICSGGATVGYLSTSGTSSTAVWNGSANSVTLTAGSNYGNNQQVNYSSTASSVPATFTLSYK